MIQSIRRQRIGIWFPTELFWELHCEPWSEQVCLAWTQSGHQLLEHWWVELPLWAVWFHSQLLICYDIHLARQMFRWDVNLPLHAPVPHLWGDVHKNLGMCTPSSIDKIDCCDVVYLQTNVGVRLVPGKCAANSSLALMWRKVSETDHCPPIVRLLEHAPPPPNPSLTCLTRLPSLEEIVILVCHFVWWDEQSTMSGPECSDGSASLQTCMSGQQVLYAPYILHHLEMLVLEEGVETLQVENEPEFPNANALLYHENVAHKPSRDSASWITFLSNCECISPVITVFSCYENFVGSISVSGGTFLKGSLYPCTVSRINGSCLSDAPPLT